MYRGAHAVDTDRRCAPMKLHDLIEPATALAYRLCAYALLNLGDDAAMLALLFC